MQDCETYEKLLPVWENVHLGKIGYQNISVFSKVLSTLFHILKITTPKLVTSF